MASNEIVFEPGSFRDRRGRVFLSGGKIYRVLNSQAASDWARLSESEYFAQNVSRGRVVRTAEVQRVEGLGFSLEGWEVLLQHDKVDVISYPYEWTFGMLRDAALLHLELLKDGLAHGFILRDSTPYNIQWCGTQPVFIDIPSFGELDPGSPWLGYRQFCQMFLNPLLLQAYFNAPFQPWLRGSLDGIDPEVVRGFFRITDILKPGVLAHVFLQSTLETRETRSSDALRKEMKEAGLHTQMIEAVVSKLQKLVGGLSWKAKNSRWSRYADSRGYEEQDLQSKGAFVSRACARRTVRTCWDVGANDGHFSLLAAEHAETVLALDSDHLVLERLYERLKAGDNRKILPLLFNFVDPSPGLGWRNSERRTLSDRSRPDLVLLLAVIHHLVIGANVPLEDLLDSWRGLNCPLVVEFVTREDPMVKALLSSRDDRFDDYDLDKFEAGVKKRFQVLEREQLQSGTRILFELAPLS